MRRCCLVEAGYARSRKVAQGARPGKVVYELTAGSAAQARKTRS
jgi:DNA-binding PadR family transcriptional regulator